MNYPESLNALIESLKKLPTIGEKSAIRLAFAILEMDKEDTDVFAQSIIDVKEKIKKCKVCGNITESEICNICSNECRELSTICVVEDSKNIVSLEKLGSYNGTYHVLNGLISPIDGKGPDDIDLDSLIKRVKSGSVKEVIIAISPTLEGETTALYISKMLEGLNVEVSRIAYGIPMGADMEYLDAMTLTMALANRNKIS